MAAKSNPTMKDSPSVQGTTPDKKFTEKLRTYLTSYGDELQSKMKRLDQLLGDAHWLSVGSYKESLVRGLLIDKIPQRFEVGTGFVMCMRGSKRIISRQIDILIWDAQEHSPVFRDGDFVIVPPEACRAAIEVKGNLDSKSLSEALENLDSLSEFNVGEDLPRDNSIHRSVFAYERGKKVNFPKSVWNSIYRHYQRTDSPQLNTRVEWSRKHLDCWSHPWINCVVVLGEGVINCELWDINGESHIAYVGYQTSKDDTVDAYGFLERSILCDLALGHQKCESRHRMPGMISVLFANRSKRLTKQSFMLLPGVNETISKAGRMKAKEIEQLAKDEYRPRKPSRYKKKG